MTELEDTLKTLTDNHKLDPITDSMKVKSQGCKLKSGEESLFVTVMCCEIQRRLEHQALHIPVHEFFYCPSRRAEWKLGFDLSLGQGDRPRRIRTMHKLLTGKLCDGQWTWYCKGEDALHMALLIGAHQVHFGVLLPFLLIHVCYCVHDYRRMGVVGQNKCSIPSFDSPLRTIIIDLAAVHDALDALKATDWPKFLEAIRTCDCKAQALEVLANFGLDRLKVVRTKPLRDLTKTISDSKAMLDEFHPALYYPAATPIANPRNLFLTFDEFLEKVTDVAQQH